MSRRQKNDRKNKKISEEQPSENADSLEEVSASSNDSDDGELVFTLDTEALERAHKALGAFDEIDGESNEEVEEVSVIRARDYAVDQEEVDEEVNEDELGDDNGVGFGELEQDEDWNSTDEASEDVDDFVVSADAALSSEASAEVPEELQGFEAAEVEDIEFIEADQVLSILEAILFSTDRPLSLDSIKQVFKGTNVKTPMIKKALSDLAIEFANPRRGVSLEEVASGYQLRTKLDNMEFLKRMVRARPFKLSGPALEVLSIVAYKQPCTKSEVDEIRGVESGHLLRALMDRSLLKFGDRSELPGKPMYYETTRKFLEIFGLRNISELPTPSEIDSLIPEGIGEPEPEEKKLSHLTEELSLRAGETYSEGETELLKISDELSTIHTSTDFFEKEKQREREKRDQERARDIQEALMVGQPVEPKDIKWLEKYQRSLVAESTELSEAPSDLQALENPPPEPIAAEENQTYDPTGQPDAMPS